MTIAAAASLGLELRGELGPPVWMPAERAWSITRYADVEQLLRSPEVQVVEVHERVARLGRLAGRDYASLCSLLAAVLFFRNPPFRAQGRRLLVRSLSALRPALSDSAVRPIVRAILAAARERGRIEAMGEICNRLPLAVMARALGLSPATAEAIAVSGLRILGAWQPALPLRALDSLNTEAGRIERLIESDMRAAGGDGATGLAVMARLNAEGFGLRPRELAGLAFFLTLAGVATTAAFMGAALYLIHLHPEAAARLRTDPALLAPALAEVLRLAGPTQYLNLRVAPEGFVLGGHRFEAGSLLIAELERAHRDPTAFPDPERFDIDRRGPPSFGFGLGAYACLGSALARLETRILLEEVFAAARVELVDPSPPWQAHAGVRRLERLDLILNTLPEWKPS